jgi:S-adenosylmethionine:tRNA ribosyltransferase-isomerase
MGSDPFSLATVHSSDDAAEMGSDPILSAPATPLRTDEVSRHAVRLVVIPRHRDGVTITKFADLASLLLPGDLVVVNDAATLPGSLVGRTERGESFELRLSAPIDGNRLYGVLLGPGDHRTRTEHRAPPPAVAVGELVALGDVGVRGDGVVRGGTGVGAPLHARVVAVAGRRVELIARESGDALWQALYASGKPVQYAHRPELLPLYAVQTAYAGRPWAAEMPSAGRPLTWDVLLGLRRAGVGIATLTHAAGLSSTGDDALDRALPWPERYEIPRRTVELVAETKARGGRVIAIGTTVVRALEAAAHPTLGAVDPAARSESEPLHLWAGSGVATLRLDGEYRLRVVDGLVSGLHVPGESHFELLSAFAPADRLARAIELAAQHGLSSHELGDACLIL